MGEKYGSGVGCFGVAGWAGEVRSCCHVLMSSAAAWRCEGFAGIASGAVWEESGHGARVVWMRLGDAAGGWRLGCPVSVQGRMLMPLCVERLQVAGWRS